MQRRAGECIHINIKTYSFGLKTFCTAKRTSIACLIEELKQRWQAKFNGMTSEKATVSRNK